MSRAFRPPRRRLRRDRRRVAPVIDTCLGAFDAGRPDAALVALQYEWCEMLIERGAIA